VRDFSNVLAFDEATGDYLWKFGPGGDFTLVDPSGTPLPDSEYQAWQHGLDFDGTTMLVYNNGVDIGQSSVIAFELDVATLTATKLWEWTEPDWYQAYLGSVDWLPSGNVLIGMGHPECFATNPGDTSTIVEIDPVTGDKLWELKHADIDVEMYRSDWADACELFANAKYCDSVGSRIDALENAFDPCFDPGDDRDDDGDGFTTCTDLDCDDADGSIHPGAAEACNGVDDDCDGALDDGLPTTVWYPDVDGDGYGDEGRAVDACVAPAGYGADGGDCDDLDPLTNPDAVEVCGGGDDDCDGFTDDLPACFGCIDEPPYAYCASATDWNSALAACEGLGYSLATIGDAAENTTVSARAAGIAGGGWWIGLSDQAVEGTFAWADGAAVTYERWYSGEPNDWGAGEDCAGTNYNITTRWNDWPCGDLLPFICEAP
jgi:hypothetical protein